MSSLRISHQGRAIGSATAGGDSGRTEHADGGASFAVALGAAGTDAKSAAATLLGGQTGGASSGSVGSRKRPDPTGKPGDAASFAASASLTAPLVIASPAPDGKHGKSTDSATTAPQDGAVATNPNGSLATAIAPSAIAGFTVGAPAVGAPAVAALTGPPLAIVAPTGASPTAAVTGSLADASTSDVAPADGSVNAPAGSTLAVQSKQDANPSKVTATDVGSVAPSVAGALSQAAAVASSVTQNPPAQTQSAPAAALGGQSLLASTSRSASAGSPGSPAGNPVPLAASESTTAAMDFGIVGSGVGAVGPTGAAPAASGASASTVGTGAPNPSNPPAPPAGSSPGLPASGHAVFPAGQASDLTSGVPATGAAAGATTAPQLATADSAAGAASPQTQPNLSADLSQLLPLMSGGQPNTGGGGNLLGDRARDRYATVVATSASAGVAAAASPADGVAGTTPLTASPSATVDPAANPAGGGSISDQISGRLVQLVSSGSRDMVMRLHPPDLGALTVQVTVSGRDVSAWFASPHPEVQNAISAGMGQLQTDLGNAGYNLNGAWVGADASGAQRQAANPLAPPPSRASSAAVFAAAPATAARPSTSGLNIYV